MTAAQEKYLRAIYDLTLQEDATRLSQIAGHVGVSKASASVAIRWLERNGYTKRQDKRLILLTPEGNQAVVLSYGKREILCRFLAEQLGVPKETATADAEQLEPLVSTQTLCAMCRHIRRGACMLACGKCDQGGL